MRKPGNFTAPSQSESHSADRPLAAGLFDFPTAGQRWRPLLLAGLLLAASLAAMPLDRYLAHWSLHKHCPTILGKVFQLSEPFGHGLGVAMIVLLVVRLDPKRFRAAPRILLTSLGAGVAADLIKVFVTRVRPRYLDLSTGTAQLMGGWLPLGSSDSHGQSFPSGHMAAAVGLAFALGVLYPRGRWFFAALALFVGCQRLDEGSHFPSDILFGAALGAFSAALFLYRGPLARLCDDRESTWQTPLRRPAVPSR